MDDNESDLPMTNKDRVILALIAVLALAITISGSIWVWHEAAKVISHIVY